MNAPPDPSGTTSPTPPQQTKGFPRLTADAYVNALDSHKGVILAVLAAFALLCGTIGILGTGNLKTGNFMSQDTESAHAHDWLATHFAAGTPHVLLLARAAEEQADTGPADAAGRALTATLTRTPGIDRVRSWWNTADPTLLSPDRRTALVQLHLPADEHAAARAHARLRALAAEGRGALRVQEVGPGPAAQAVNDAAQRDAVRAELIAVPVTVLVLLLAFGSPLAVLLPLSVGIVAISGTLAVLVSATRFVEVSVLAMNMTSVLGLGLAVDYSLLIIDRFRTEREAAQDVVPAMAGTLRTAGRTVVFSAVTVAAALAGLLAFPSYALRSVAYAAISVVLLAAAAAVLVTPVLLLLFGHRPSVTRRRVWRRTPQAPARCARMRRLAVRRPGVVAVGGLLLLAGLAVPAADLRFGFGEERVLPPGSPVRVAGERLRTEFPALARDPLRIALPGTGGTAHRAAAEQYAQRLSVLPDVVRVDADAGSFSEGTRSEAPRPTPAEFSAGAGTWMRVVHSAPDDAAAARLADRVRALPAPGPALVGGGTTATTDTMREIRDRIPAAVTIVAGGSALLLLFFTRSLLIPLKFLFVSGTSLLATAGLMTAAFQKGRLGPFFATFQDMGRVDLMVALVVFCITFGLALDYEMFLMAGMVEHHRRTGETEASIAAGVRSTGWLITTAALVLACLLAVVGTSRMANVRMFGFATAAALVIDATLVRAVLVPALMRLAGDANWWWPRRARSPKR